MSIVLTINCPTHPRYKAIQLPTADCENCRKLYDLKAELKKLAKMSRKLDNTVGCADGKRYPVCERSFCSSPVVPNMLIKAVM